MMWAAFGSVEPEMGWRAALGAPETLRGILDSFGAWGPVACVVFQVVQVVVAPIPANAITTLRDAAFRTLRVELPRMSDTSSAIWLRALL